MKKLFVFVFFLSFCTILTACGGGGGGEDNTQKVNELLQQGKAALQTGDGVLALEKFNEALSYSPDNADANFGVAFIELMRNGNQIVNFLSAQNDPLFRNISWVVLEPMIKFSGQKQDFFSLSRILSNGEDDVIVDDLTFEQIRQEIISLIAPLESIRTHLRNAIDTIGSNHNWQYVVPEDWNEPSAGSVTIWTGDLLMLSATINAILGAMHLSVAYSPGPLAIHMDEFGDIEITGMTHSGTEIYEDTNQDGYIDLGEIADQDGYPAGFGVLASDGHSHLNSVVTSWKSMFTDFRDAVNSYIAVDAPLNHWAFDDLTDEEYYDFKTDWNAYLRGYTDNIISAFTSDTTFTIHPQLLADYPELGDDPGADFTVKLDFAAFFTNMPDDMRDFPLRFVLGPWGDLTMPDNVNEALTNTTILGLFPDGMTQRIFDELFFDE